MSTITRLSDAAARSIACSNSAISSDDRAFRVWGELSVIVAVRRETSRVTRALTVGFTLVRLLEVRVRQSLYERLPT